MKKTFTKQGVTNTTLQESPKTSQFLFWELPGLHFGRVWAPLGRVLAVLGCVLGAPGVLLGSSWASLGRSWASLGCLLGFLGVSRAHLVRFGVDFGGFQGGFERGFDGVRTSK